MNTDLDLCPVFQMVSHIHLVVEAKLSHHQGISTVLVLLVLFYLMDIVIFLKTPIAGIFVLIDADIDFQSILFV